MCRQLRDGDVFGGGHRFKKRSGQLWSSPIRIIRIGAMSFDRYRNGAVEDASDARTIFAALMLTLAVAIYYFLA
jgi:hypothetical protein